MVSPEQILAVLLALTPHVTDAGDTADERALLLAPVASAISTAARDTSDAAALIAHGAVESRYARYVIEGRCQDGPRGARCDPDRQGRARARGPWQVWAVACPDAWELPVGHESLHREAACTLRLLRGGRMRCQSWVGAFASLGGGARCSSPTAMAKTRARQWAALQLWRAAQ